jgi:hypothetical protein
MVVVAVEVGERELQNRNLPSLFAQVNLDFVTSLLLAFCRMNEYNFV